MLSDWYFCAALRLPPQQTAAHLELLRVLRDSQESAEVVGDDVLTEAIRMLAEAGPGGSCMRCRWPWPPSTPAVIPRSPRR